MIDGMYQYNGPGKPIARFDVYGLFKADFMTVVAMSPAEEEYLYALQLVHGVELTVVGFQHYHDLVWEKARTEGIASYMHNVCCSYSGLTDLLMSPTGDLKWKRELERRERCRPLYDTHFDMKGLI